MSLSSAMEKFLEKAARFSEGGDPEESLTNMRKFTEAAVKELGRRYDCLDEGKKYGFKVTIQNLQNHLPARLFYYIEFIQSMGNYGAHFQEDGVEPSKEDTEYCVYAGREVYRWISPPVDPIEQTAVFIENAYEAVDCPTCGRKKGERCKSIFSGTHPEWEGEHDNIHQDRAAEYSNYRREFQKHYRTTLVDAMHEMVADVGLSGGEIIKSGEITSWFKNRYPAYNKKSVGAHTRLMTTNMVARYSHTLSESKDYNLFFRLDSGVYRLYDSTKDPAPLTQRPEFEDDESE